MAKQLVQGYSMNVTAVAGHGPTCLPSGFQDDMRLGDSDTHCTVWRPAKTFLRASGARGSRAYIIYNYTCVYMCVCKVLATYTGLFPFLFLNLWYGVV